MNDSTMNEFFSQINFKNDIGMYYCGERINTHNHIYGPQIRDHYLLVLVNNGKAEMCDDRGISFGKHDLLVMCPNTIIHYKALEPWSINWLGLYGDTVKEYMDLLGVSPQNPILHISLYNELKAVMDNINTASEDDSFETKLSVMGLIYEFFSILIKNSTVNQKTDFIIAAKKIFDYNFCTDISIEQIAVRLSVDPAYFSRKFTQQVGLSPKQYILNKRIERAKELLRVTNAGIFEIANSIGYDDQFYFCRIFKKISGMSPSQYRKKQSTLNICK